MRRQGVGVLWVMLAGLMTAGCANVAPPPAPEPSPAKIQATPVRPRAAHTATLLEDGSVLLAGGCDTDGCAAAATAPSTEIYVPGQGFRAGPPMQQPRDGHTATVLRDGRVLFVGGFAREGEPPLTSAELFDPASGRFEQAGRLTTGRSGHIAALLPDGRVLIAGGWVGPRRYTADAEIFDPTSLMFSAAAPMTQARHAAASSTLRDGEVLVTGGQDAYAHGLDTAQLFDPAGQMWRSVARMSSPRFKHAAVAWRDGSVLILGGTTDDKRILSSVEVFDPARRAFTAGPPMTVNRYKFADGVAARGDGCVVVAAGGSRVETLGAAGKFTTVPSTEQAQRSFATATVLADGRVLVVGGYDRSIRLHPDAFLVTVDGRRTSAA